MTSRTYKKVPVNLTGTNMDKGKQIVNALISEFSGFSIYEVQKDDSSDYQVYIRFKDTPILLYLYANYRTYDHFFVTIYRLNDDATKTRVNDYQGTTYFTNNTDQTLYISIANIGDYLVGIQFDFYGQSTGLYVSFAYALAESLGKNIYFTYCINYSSDGKGSTEYMPLPLPGYYYSSKRKGYSYFGWFTDDDTQYSSDYSYFSAYSSSLNDNVLNAAGKNGVFMPVLMAFYDYSDAKKIYSGPLKFGGTDILYEFKPKGLSSGSLINKNSDITIDGVTYKAGFMYMIFPFPAS